MKIIDTQEILQTYTTVAIYGASANPEKASHRVAAYLSSKGYTVIPINPKAEAVLGRTGYAKLEDVPEAIDVVDIFRPAAEIPSIVQDVIARKQAKGDVSVVWLQEGIENEEGMSLAEAVGLNFVQNRCMKKEHERLFGTKSD